MTEVGIQSEHLHNHLADRIRFERLISDLSARFVNIPPDQVDSAIEVALQEILDFFQVDQVALLLHEINTEYYQHTHTVSAPRIPLVPLRVDLPTALFPYMSKKLIEERSIVSFKKLEELPEEAATDKQSFTDWGIRSCMNIPISLQKSFMHIISITSVLRECAWPEIYIPRLQLIGEIFVNALERRRIQLELEDREYKYRTVLESTPDWLYWANPDGTILYMSSSCERITGFTEREFMEKPERIREIVVAEDRLHWDTHFQKSQNKPGILEIQFRIRHRDGSLRWIEHTCLPMFDSQGASLGFRISNRDITQQKQMETQLLERYKEIKNLKQQLEKENISLRREVHLQHVHEEIVGRSEAMINVLSQAEQVATTDATVLIQGETGTGKELLAKAIHQLGQRKDRPLVTVNCARLPPSLMESELFGREKGAYTGALTRMAGRFEVADGSTIFLDEIGELPMEIQSKLLRVLEEGRFERLGSTKTIHANVRIIAATNKDLELEVNDGKFRKDLYYRLKVFPIYVPPLRERAEDIPRLVWALVRQLEQKIGKRIDSVSRKTMADLQRYSWPGNVRELRNIIEHAMIVCKDSKLIVHIPDRIAADEKHADIALEDMERRYIVNVLKKTGWRISGSDGAAEILGLKRTTLQSRIKKLEIKRPGT